MWRGDRPPPLLWIIMKIFLSVFLALTFLFNQPAECKHHHPHHKKYETEVALVAMFQNEADYLYEWVLYHSLLGVDHFYLYNNNSTDNYQETLAYFINSGIVEIKDWPSPADHDWTPYQKQAYNDCLEKIRGKVKWLVVIDTDEFIVLHNSLNLKTFLKPYEKKKEFGGVVLNWQMFGTSGYYQIPEDKFMIECLTWKAPSTYASCQNQKSIVKVDSCASYEIHYANYKAGRYHVKPYDSGDGYGIKQAQINHYWTRDEKFLREVKAPRRARYEGWLWGEDAIQYIMSEHCKEEDLSIQKLVPAMKRMDGLLNETSLKAN